MLTYMKICPKCASFKISPTCPFCNVQRVETDITDDEEWGMSKRQKEELINHYIETLIKDTYDPKAREYREANEEEIFSGYVPESKPTCPTCHSQNVQRISGIERGASVIGFGLLSNKINKSFKCRSCGYTW